MSRVILDARNDLLWDGVGLSRRDLATIQGSLDRGEAVFVNFPLLVGNPRARVHCFPGADEFELEYQRERAS